jgi:iron complex transport system substrate-binding protein
VAERIVSLLPSATEILFFCGAGDRVVGVTYECLEPPEAAERPKVTDTIVPAGATPAEIDELIRDAMTAGRELYLLDRELLRTLDPDLIVTQDLCRVCALPAGTVDDAVAELGCTADVLSYDPMTLEEVLVGIERIGAAVGSDRATARVADLRRRLDAVRARVAGRPRPRVLLLEWPDPPYTPGHWIPDQIVAAGGEPVLAHPGGRSSATSWDAVTEADPEVLVVAPCGFDEAAAAEQLRLVVGRPEVAGTTAARTGRVHAIDADGLVVRPGPRLVDGVEALSRLFHPDAWSGDPR